MKSAMLERDFWSGKRVFLTGHTGFMGSWLTLWLERLGAFVTGYSNGLAANASMYRMCGLEAYVPWIRGDIRDTRQLVAALQQAKPDLIFHLAGASTPASLDEPAFAELFGVESVGTAALLDAVRLVSGDVPVRAVVLVTADDCYAAQPWAAGLRESDPLGGDTPAAAGKACAELVAAAFRRAFFACGAEGPAMATARTGHLIGGGDFAAGRFVPDCVRAVAQGRALQLPAADRPGEAWPWLHVLEALAGCLALAQRLFPPGGDAFAEAWNFGPRAADARTQAWLAEALCDGLGSHWAVPAAAEREAAGAGERGRGPSAAPLLDTAKAAVRLGWYARLDARQAVMLAAEWYAAWMKGLSLREISAAQIARYEGLLAERG